MRSQFDREVMDITKNPKIIANSYFDELQTTSYIYILHIVIYIYIHIQK